MVPFTDNLLRACRKLAIKLEDSMRFQGRVFLSEIGSPEHDYRHLLRLFGEQIWLSMLLLCMHACMHCQDNHVIVHLGSRLQTTASSYLLC